MEEAPPFYALSYCWGEEPADQVAQIDGQSFAVSPNLKAGLSSAEIYLKEQVSYLWVDAICIWECYPYW